ncbi:hypothetical protein ACJZ2D_014656 [Fusarium nematophilum]
MSLLAYLLVAMGFNFTNAQPTATTETTWDEGARESLIYLVNEGSKVLEDLAGGPESMSRTSRSDNGLSKRNQKGAIIGGTVASVIVLGVTIFVGVHAYRQFVVNREHRAGTAQSQGRASDLEATPETPTHDSWRHTFNRRVSVGSISSVDSDCSFHSTAAQVWIVPPSRMPRIQTKAAEVLGIEDQFYGSNQAPVSPLPQPASAPTRNSQHGHYIPSSLRRFRAYSDRTMKPPSSAEFATVPDNKPLPRPPPIAKAPATTRMSSRRYFMPTFEDNGQGENVSVGTVKRDGSRAKFFPLDGNRI